MSKKLSQKEVERRFEEVNLILLSEYKNKDTKVLTRCKKCGYEWTVYPNSVFKKHGCPKCKGNKKYTKDEIEKILKKYNYELLSDYVNFKTKIKVRCIKCGDISEKQLRVILNGHICRNCLGIKKYNNDIVQKKFNESGLKLLEDYKNNETKVKTKCKKCGYEWHVRPEKVFRGSKCPRCGKNTPKWEKDIYNIFKEKGIENILLHYKYEGNKEIDIYFPDYRLGIELNCLFWHSYIPGINYKDKKWIENHLYQKKIETLKKGIDVIFIFEHEYYNKHVFNKIINYILAKIGIFKKKIYARKCKFQEISYNLAFEFYEENHILGKPPHGKHFGLIYGDEIVSMISFRKEKDEWTITRYCPRNNYKIIGGFNKLFKNSVKELNINIEKENIVTFIDLRFVNPNNNVFTRNGFEKIKIINPRYFYWTICNNNFEILPRRKAQKKYLSKILPKFYFSMSEEENVLKYFHGKCYDAGKIKLMVAKNG